MTGTDKISKAALSHVPLHREILSRVYWLIQLRYLAVIGVCLVLLVCRALAIQLPYTEQVVLLFLLLLSNLFYHFKASRLERLMHYHDQWMQLAKIQIWMDFLLLTFQLHFSGGVENPFSIYYIFHTAFAGLLLPSLSAALAAAWGILLFSGMVMGEGMHYFEHHGLSICHSEQFYRNPLALFAAIISLGSGMFFMTYLTASISRVIRKKEENESLLQKKVASRSQELVKVNRQLTHTMQMREQFLFTVEHELKAPLSAIISNLEAILAAGDQLPHTMRSMISRSADRSRGLLALVQDLLILTRLEHKESSQCAELISISSILLDEIALIEPVIHNKNLNLETKIPPRITVFGFPDPLRYCITNLLSNAVKYTLRGTIKITLAVINDEVSLSVEDTGIGIPQDEQDKIFTDFYRTQEAKNTASDGTGLGLSLVKRVMDQMYGRIELHSTPGKSSTFTLFFPKPFPS